MRIYKLKNFTRGHRDYYHCDSIWSESDLTMSHKPRTTHCAAIRNNQRFHLDSHFSRFEWKVSYTIKIEQKLKFDIHSHAYWEQNKYTLLFMCFFNVLAAFARFKQTLLRPLRIFYITLCKFLRRKKRKHSPWGNWYYILYIFSKNKQTKKMSEKQK